MKHMTKGKQARQPTKPPAPSLHQVGVAQDDFVP
jgi:hypothetical protein